jgi:PadR family transcriptional regulator PadR
MGERADVWQGTLAFMVLKTLSAGATARVRDCAPDRTDSGRPDGRELRDVYPALLKLERRALFPSGAPPTTSAKPSTTSSGRKQLDKEEREWEQITEILARFLSAGKESG